MNTPTTAEYNRDIEGANVREFDYDFKKEVMYEFLGMYIFLTLSLSNVAIYALYPEARLTWTSIAISWGLNLFVGLKVASIGSKAHLNPAVTLCMCAFDEEFNFLEALWYMISQFVASIFAALTTYLMYFNNMGKDDSFSGILTTYRVDSITNWTAFFTEFWGTAFLVAGVFFLCKKKNAPVLIGIWLSILVLSFGYQTAFAWNPARDFGPRLVALVVGYNSFGYRNCYFWIPLIADFIGGFVGCIFAKFFLL